MAQHESRAAASSQKSLLPRKVHLQPGATDADVKTPLRVRRIAEDLVLPGGRRVDVRFESERPGCGGTAHEQHEVAVYRVGVADRVDSKRGGVAAHLEDVSVGD